MSTTNFDFENPREGLEFLDGVNQLGTVLISKDDTNIIWFVEVFETIDQALNELLSSKWNTDKTPEEMKGMADDVPIWIFEHSGRLYDNHEGETNPYYLLFRPEEYTEEKPKTIAELREYMRNGSSVCLGWSDRAQATYQILSVTDAKEHFRQILNDWNQADD